MKTLDIFKTLEKPSDKWSGYFDVYDRHLGRFMGTDVNLVEVGVQKGGSLELWTKYFGQGSKITGVDIDPACAGLTYPNWNVEVVIGDQGDPAFWAQFLSGPDFKPIDIFIDDGGHFMDPQLLTFQAVWPKIKTGGVYICEDTHTSYKDYNGGGLERKFTLTNYMKGLVDVLHYNWKESMTTDLETQYRIAGDLSSIHFYDSILVVEKLPKINMERIFPDGNTTN